MTRGLGMGNLPVLLEEMAGQRSVRHAFNFARLPVAIIDQPEMKIPLGSLQRLFTSAADQVGTRDFGLRVGLDMRHTGYGDWSNYLTGAETLGGALNRAIRSIWVYQSGGVMGVRSENERAVFYYKAPDCGIGNWVQHSDHVLPSLISLMRFYLGPRWMPLWGELDYPRDSHAQLLEERLGVRIRFGAPAVGVAFDRQVLRTTRPPDRPAALMACRSDLVAKLAPSRPDDLVGVVRDLISLSLLEGPPNLDAVAMAADRGVRTLQADLNSQGISFREIVDQVRFSKAAERLGQGSESVTAIALSLGYTEPANFTRAFRRWSGFSPAAFRSLRQAGLDIAATQPA